MVKEPNFSSLTAKIEMQEPPSIQKSTSMKPWGKRIIIGGLPRSGSTLLRFMLDRAPSILAGPETNFFRMPLWHCQAKIDDVSSYISSKFKINQDDIRAAINSSHTSVEAFDKIITSYRDANSPTANIWAEKSPNNCYSYHRLLAENSELYFISTVRHGLDVVTSKIKNHPVNSDYWCPIQRYIDDCTAVANFSHHRHFILSYEDLVTTPTKTAKELFSFLEIDFEESCLTDFNAKSPTRDLTKVNQEKLKGPLSSQWVDRWRDSEHTEKVIEFKKNSQAMRWLNHFEYKA
ncbi:sulfotransferase [bacterium]|nr:sulfotransferase [bacterium]